MNIDTVVTRLAALAQTSRLSTFRLLVEKGPDGMSAGVIAEKLRVAPNNLSFHLKELCGAGLIRSRQEGRFVYYSADFSSMNSLLEFLTTNCCAGSVGANDCLGPDVCLDHGTSVR